MGTQALQIAKVNAKSNPEASKISVKEMEQFCCSQSPQGL